MRRNTVGNLALTSYDEIFGTGMTNDGVCIVEKPLIELFAPDNHPFKVSNDEAMARLTESIKQHGVREPGIARPRDGGGYELLCGNRRKRASELAGMAIMPVIIRDMDDDTAALVMVDSNLEHREKILPSEKAAAYRVMMEALIHNGVKGESHSYEIMMERTGESKNQVFRIIRLTELIDALADNVDNNKLAFTAAVELSYLSVAEQAAVAEAMAANEAKPSQSQAIRLKKLKQDGKLTFDIITSVLSETKKPQKNEPSGSMRFRKYFPPEYSQKQMDAVIRELLADWQKARAAV